MKIELLDETTHDSPRFTVKKILVGSASVFSSYGIKLKAKLKNKKPFTFYLDDELCWAIVEKLQAQYPQASYWKTKSQRLKASMERLGEDE
jgi:hypothetical protein